MKSRNVMLHEAFRIVKLDALHSHKYNVVGQDIATIIETLA